MTSDVPIAGLVLAGGNSHRMQRDKALLEYHGRPQVEWMFDLLQGHFDSVFVSVRPDQTNETVRARLPLLIDRVDAGPAGGILSAMNLKPNTAWLVIACDLPFVADDVITQLLAARDPSRDATAFISTHDDLPEPLCAIWEPKIRSQLEQSIVQRRFCPRKVLLGANTHLVEQQNPHSLHNINTPEDLQEVLA